jgi:RecA-family ATPase
MPRRLEDLVPGLLHLGTLTLVAGIGGLGKSALMAEYAAQTSIGKLLGSQAADVVLVTYEDLAEEIVRPRLEAAGADLDRVHIVSVPLDRGGLLMLPFDLDELERHVRETYARLLVIDPIVSAIDLDLDAHKDQHVRVVLAGLAKLTAETRCATAMVGHLNKTESKDAYLRIGGSVAFYNAARSVVLVTADSQEPEQHRLVTQVKANWSRRQPVQRYVLEEIALDGPDQLVAVRMRYLEDASEIDRDDVLADPRERRDGDAKVVRAIVFLEASLRDGEKHDSAGLKVLAAERDISEATLKRAKSELGVEHERVGYPGTTYWWLPARLNGSPALSEPTDQEDASRHGYSESDVLASQLAWSAPGTHERRAEQGRGRCAAHIESA